MFYPYRRPGKMNEYGTKRIPDYTELAYKEAVGKLRYFLSGNYSPSVRSYGGSPSIKNLEDSDGDLDKKYGSYPALLEKRCPRLTTKYATLYADSLQNYTPSVSAPGPAPTTGDTSATNPDVVNFIQKQEEYIEQLERESQYCRDELNNLLGKVKEVISENEHLHEAQKDKLISKMFHWSSASETDEVDNDNAVPKTRKTRARAVKLEGPNIVFESRIAELEAQLTQAKIDLKKVQEENNENKRKIASGVVESTCLDGFKRQIDNLQRDKTSLESQISKLKASLEIKDDDRYKRGSDVIEQQLREERNNLELEIRRLKDDLTKERSKVRELCGEGARRAIQERSAAEQRYNVHCDELARDLAAQCDNVARLQLELERQRRDENDLKRELSMKNAAIEELKMEIKNKTAGLQADLAQAYAEKASLEEELASARLTMERHQRQAKHETNRLNSEIQSIRQRLDRADADLVHSRRENLRLSDQIASLEKELNMKTLTPASPQKSKKEKEMSSMIENIENKHARTVVELESMIHSQNSLMEKLTGECRLLTDKLDDANRRHKEELATLQRQVETLGRSLHPASTDTHYQAAPTTHTPPAHRNDDTPHRSGQDNPRDNSAIHAALAQQPITDVRRYGDNNTDQSEPLSKQRDNDQSRTVSRQGSRQSVKQKLEEPIEELVRNSVAEYPTEDIDKQQLEQTSEYQAEAYNQNYQEKYPENTENANQSYEQQSYEQPVQQDYEQQPYVGQYDQNYDQYPQQYVDPNDPNAQYAGQYENYNTDPIYQNVESYSEQPVEDDKTSDYNTANQEYSPQEQAANSEDVTGKDITVDQKEGQRNNSPTQKQPVKS